MINYKNGNLTVESVDVSKIVSEVGTPFYCYSYNKILDQYRGLLLRYHIENFNLFCG